VSATTHLLHWYQTAEILRRAPHPFRCLEPDWPERIERVLNDAELAAEM
jgi:hypothetical protein